MLPVAACFGLLLSQNLLNITSFFLKLIWTWITVATLHYITEGLGSALTIHELSKII